MTFLMRLSVNIHSLLHYGKDYVLTLFRQTNRVGRSLLVKMTSDQGERRKLSYFRLKYAVDHGVAYDEIPPEYHIMPTDNGGEVATRTEHMERSMKKVRGAANERGLQVMDYQHKNP